MPFRKTPNTLTPYALVAYEKNGGERTDDPDGIGGLLSARLLQQLSQSQPTDIFLFSHGWRGDMGAAIDQYDRWIDAMNRLSADSSRMGPGFHPLWVGIHWPSEPWGDEEFQTAQAFAVQAESEALALPSLLETYLERLNLTDSPRARTLLEIIFDENRRNAAAQKLPPEIASAYSELASLLQVEGKGVGADPGSDNAEFDPQAAFDAMNSSGLSFGNGIVGGLLGPLRTLSFWTIKRRARTVGESGVFPLVSWLPPAAPQCRFHLMGHSFGCIVVSSICGGPDGTTSLPRPIDSLALIQGAVSFWSYADSIPSTGGKGYFNAMFRRGSVRGPIITTQSIYDFAVGAWYPAAVGLLLSNPNFDPNSFTLVKWGGIGTFGIQGLPNLVSTKLMPVTGDYQFESGRVYNFEASEYIKKKVGASGAHSDIDGPEVAHALWQVALSAAAGKPATFTAAVSTPTNPASLPTQQSSPKTPLAEEPMPIPFGVQAETGQLLLSIQISDLSHIGKDPASAKRRATQTDQVFGVIAEVDSDNLAQAGWSILFAANMNQDQAAVKQALKPLLDRRRQQAAARYLEFEGETGYAKDQEADAWLSDRGASLAVVNPSQGVPYYLLLVGSADDIPFEFQYDLDTFFAVGRLYFETVEEYARYATNMVAYEDAATVPHGKTIALFVTRNDGDAATGLLHDRVGIPLAAGDPDAGFKPLGEDQGYTITKRFAANATKCELLNVLGAKTDAGVPALLFTGSHGVAFSPNDTNQKMKQGALLTQSWKGPGTAVTPDTYLTADEISRSPAILGSIHYFFACYSAGCPTHDTYSYDANDTPVAIANQTIIARLPQQMLLNGAQAVIGHIDRAWAFSFQSRSGVAVVQNLRDSLVRILQGRRVGDAMDVFNQRWSVLSGQLLKLVQRRSAAPAAVSASRLANSWVERDDARNYIILGDPAAKLRTPAATAS